MYGEAAVRATVHGFMADLGPGVGSAARAATPGGFLAAQRDVQGRQVQQDTVLADVGILGPVGVGRGGAGVAMAPPVGGLAVRPG
jgi:hypothetical protein